MALKFVNNSKMHVYCLKSELKVTDPLKFCHM